MAVADMATGSNTEPPALSPYEELCWRALRSAIRSVQTNWLWLDRDGRRRLEDNGLDRDDLRAAINYGVAEGLLTRKVESGVPCVKLTPKGEGR